ncbi:MAG: hypothetical protein GY792_31340, partial [Gammaproteobacteria bacterium]|nr:hypothetical protein [Gammaproteobacteria bacterium]
NLMTTTQTNEQPRRVFKYGSTEFPDPGSEYTPEQILAHLKGFYPELGHAKIEKKTLPDGALEITFSKQVTRKGI